MNHLAVLFAVSILIVVQQPDMVIFGLRLAQPFDIPECRKMKLGNSVTYSGPTKGICFQRGYGKESQSGPVEGSVSIEFPIMELPLGVTGGSVGGTIIDRRLEGVIIGTSGLSVQFVMLGKLKEKYGEPSQFIARKVQNRLGASFETFTATWTFENLLVVFNGVDGSLDHGLMTIGTKKGAEYRERQLKELFKDRRPF